MLHTISNQELEHLLTLDHPTWTPQAIAQQAEEYRNFLDDRLDAPLRRYLDTGKPQQFQVVEVLSSSKPCAAGAATFRPSSSWTPT